MEARSTRCVSIYVSICAAFVGVLTMSMTGQTAAEEVDSRAVSVSRLPKHVTPETEAAIDRGLAYLAQVQDRQGSWSNREGYGAYPVAMTALAHLALLMDGNTTTQGRYAPEVDRATRFLVASATPSGLIARVEAESRPMYGHGFTMLTLGQLYGMTEDVRRAEEIHHVLSEAVQLTARAQSRLGGWIYTPDSRGDEGSVTVTQVQGLRSCRNAGIAVPKSVIDGAMDYLKLSQNSDGGIRYTAAQSGRSRAPITAAAVCCWFNAGEYDNPRARKALAFCKETIRPTFVPGGHSFYAHLYFSQALYVSRDPYWDQYYPVRRDFLLANQAADGSWVGDRIGDVYDTALALIFLQMPFNQLPIMQR
ncbi:MAG: terpene cyclase/mutase family protein [Planctomycetes bacterium]|nr:terpene cyclase/mutase family protein [Planctomycetota bacterium]